jgi:peptidoglycan hydrolase-like protein with peptidoglycan-binding domain
MAFPHLSALTGPQPVATLDSATLFELQDALARLGYPIAKIDGEFGPNTRGAWAEFKTDVFSGNPDLIAADSVAVLLQKVQQLEAIEASDQSSKPAVIGAINAECQALDLGLKTQIAYVAATTQWETAQTFKPVKEAYWNDEAWRKAHLHYYPYYGRGYVQLTWVTNYQKYSDILGLDLVNNPDLALDPKVALFVLVHGFKTGTFTGRKITDYITASQTDFVDARRCINGTDKASEIAKLAQSFMTTL